MKQTCKSTGNSIKASLKWSNWSPLEKDLYLKGLQIFGRNRYVEIVFMVKNITLIVSDILNLLDQRSLKLNLNLLRKVYFNISTVYSFKSEYLD